MRLHETFDSLARRNGLSLHFSFILPHWDRTAIPWMSWFYGNAGDTGLCGQDEAGRRDRGNQKEKGEDWVRNGGLAAVARHAQTHSTVKRLGDLRPHLVEEIKEFFVDYNKLRKRQFKPRAEAAPRKARELVEAGRKIFARKSQERIEALTSRRREIMRLIGTRQSVAKEVAS